MKPNSVTAELLKRMLPMLLLSGALGVGAGFAAARGLPQTAKPRTPAESLGTLSYVGNYESGTYKPWDNLQVDPRAPASDGFQVVTNPVRQGRFAAKFTVRQAFSPYGWKESAEVSHEFDDQTEGSDYYYGLSVMLPASTVQPHGWFTIEQWYTQDFTVPYFQGPAPIALDAGSNAIRLNVLTGRSTNISWGYHLADRVLDKGPVYDGRWRDFILHIRWSKADGILQVWERKQGSAAWKQLLSLTRIPTLRYNPAYNNGAADSIGLVKQGAYRDSYCKADSAGNIFGPDGAHTPGSCYYGATGSQPDTVIYDDGFARGSKFGIVARALGRPLLGKKR